MDGRLERQQEGRRNLSVGRGLVIEKHWIEGRRGRRTSGGWLEARCCAAARDLRPLNMFDDVLAEICSDCLLLILLY